jgi:hypothetical protein
VTLTLAAAAGALCAAGIVLIGRGLIGVPLALPDVVADLHRRRTGAVAPTSPPLIGLLAGPPSEQRAKDLRVCERSDADWILNRLAWSGIGAAPGLAFAVLSAIGLATWVSTEIALVAIPLGGACGWCYATVDLRADAAKGRRQIRHSVSAYLELVTILMAGGAGPESAMFDAATIGRGSAFRHLQTALGAAQIRREPPWAALGRLGDRLGVTELAELHASMTLAGGGARVRDSLTAKAAAIRARDLAELETEAQRRSETMVLPVAMMFAGFLLLLGYPALAGLSGP